MASKFHFLTWFHTLNVTCAHGAKQQHYIDWEINSALTVLVCTFPNQRTAPIMCKVMTIMVIT